MADIWSSHLYVFPVANTITISNQSCSGVYAADIPASLTGVDDADLVIFVGADDNCASETLAYASPCSLDLFDRPVIGRINFCLDNIQENFRRLEEETHDNRKLNPWFLEDEIAYSTLDSLGQNNPTADTTLLALHEVGHVLGVNLVLFRFFRDAETGEPLTPRPFAPIQVKCDDGTVQNIIFPVKLNHSGTSDL